MSLRTRCRGTGPCAGRRCAARRARSRWWRAGAARPRRGAGRGCSADRRGSGMCVGLDSRLDVGVGKDPDVALLLAHRVGGGLAAAQIAAVDQAGDRLAGAAAVELPAVIAALQVVALDAADRQRHVAVRAAVEQGADLARLGAEHHQRDAEDGERQGLGGLQIARATGDVPIVGHARHRQVRLDRRRLQCSRRVVMLSVPPRGWHCRSARRRRARGSRRCRRSRGSCRR
jgi:hypothetical protein